MAATNLGLKPPFDPAKVANMEDIIKDTNTLGVNLTTNLLGDQREAAETIRSMIHSVPGIANTYLGAKLVTDGLMAINRRAVDKYQFVQEARARNNGYAPNAEAVFDAKFPPSTYLQPIVEKYGMTPKGFTSADAIAKNYAAGYMTRKQAEMAIDSLPKGAKSAGLTARSIRSTPLRPRGRTGHSTQSIPGIPTRSGIPRAYRDDAGPPGTGSRTS